ncbi:hypothetical protein C8Q74DRAFT_220667 [Fomes fomentarius]|nr:hypothetical protein C8Q74DRAFT_220667 [Fomes fomentarius]
MWFQTHCGYVSVRIATNVLPRLLLFSSLLPPSFSCLDTRAVPSNNKPPRSESSMVLLAQILLGVVFSPVCWTRVVSRGETECLTGELDWYTSVVGETPCTTYQRLRQICNTSYQVLFLPLEVPPDMCSDPIPYCCCNYIAYQLSMLCLNCQYDTVLNGTEGGIGAPGDAFERYLASCPNGTGRRLSQDVQDAVCNEGLRLDDYLYNGGTEGGSWNYSLVKGNMILEHLAKNNNTFFRCSDVTTTTTTSSSAIVASSSTSTDISTSGPTAVGSVGGGISVPTKPSTNAIVGAVLGGIGPLAIVAAICFFCAKRRGSKRDVGVQTSKPDSDDKPLTLKPSTDPIQLMDGRVSHNGSRASYDLRGALIEARERSLRTLPSSDVRAPTVVHLRPLSTTNTASNAPSIYTVRRSASTNPRPSVQSDKVDRSQYSASPSPDKEAPTPELSAFDFPPPDVVHAGYPPARWDTTTSARSGAQTLSSSGWAQEQERYVV